LRRAGITPLIVYSSNGIAALAGPAAIDLFSWTACMLFSAHFLSSVPIDGPGNPA
jgi:hypothetical protein